MPYPRTFRFFGIPTRPTRSTTFLPPPHKDSRLGGGQAFGDDDVGAAIAGGDQTVAIEIGVVAQLLARIDNPCHVAVLVEHVLPPTAVVLGLACGFERRGGVADQAVVGATLVLRGLILTVFDEADVES